MTQLPEIKTFLRVDDNLLNLLTPVLSHGVNLEGHYAVWMVPRYRIAPEVMEWLSVQPSNSTTLCNWGIELIGIGISYSTLTAEQLAKYIWPNLSRLGIVEVNKIDMAQYSPTKNPYLWREMGKEFMYIERIITAPPPVAVSADDAASETFTQLLAGFDHWYSFSDSHRVYKRGEERRAELVAEGQRLGLTKDQIERIFTQERRKILGS